MYKLNQRVLTKYGKGVIVNFEVLGVTYALIVDTYENGARMGVKLDTPENWPLHAQSSSVPYFMPSDLEIL